MSAQIELVGFLAGGLTTFCWVPQAVMILKSRNTKAISLAAQTVFTAGCALWFVYGLILGSPSIALFNLITTCLAASITVLKIYLG